MWIQSIFFPREEITGDRSGALDKNKLEVSLLIYSSLCTILLWTGYFSRFFHQELAEPGHQAGSVSV